MKKSTFLNSIALSLIVIMGFSASFSTIAEIDDIQIDIPLKHGVKIPILMYHHISDEITSSSVVTPEKFLNDMETLKEAGYEGIFLNELLDYLNGYGELPEKPIIITFDDGYYSNYEYAYPIALETDMKITISIIGWSHSRDSFINNDKSIIPHFGWDETMEMLDSGIVDIQNHTFDLHSPKGLSYGYEREVALGVMPLEGEDFKSYESRLKDDLLAWNVKIFNHTNHMPTFLFYPYGAFNENTEKIISRFGFNGSLTTIEGVRYYNTSSDLKMMPRLNVPNNLKGDDLLNKIERLPLK